MELSKKEKRKGDEEELQLLKLEKVYMTRSNDL